MTPEQMPQLPPPSKKTDRKVKLASWATFALTLAGIGVLNGTVTDMVPALPDVLESVAYAGIVSAVTWLTGYNTKAAANGEISESQRDAVLAWIEKQMRRRAPGTGMNGG